MWRYVASGLGGAVLALLIAAAVLFALDLEIVEDQGPEAGSTSTTELVDVPSVVGEDPDTARAEIEALGLEVRTLGGNPSTSIGGVPVTPEQCVGEQIPAGGSQARADAIVTLRVENCQ